MKTDLMLTVDEFGKIKLKHIEGKLFKIVRFQVRCYKINNVKSELGLHR